MLLKLIKSKTKDSKQLDVFFGMFLGYCFVLVGVICWFRWAFRINYLGINQSLYILLIANATVWAGLFLIYASKKYQKKIQQDLKNKNITIIKKKE